MLLSLKTIQYSMNMRCVLCVWDTTSGNITQIYCRMWLCNAKCFQSFYSLRFGRLRMHKKKNLSTQICCRTLYGDGDDGWTGSKMVCVIDRRKVDMLTTDIPTPDKDLHCRYDKQYAQ